MFYKEGAWKPRPYEDRFENAHSNATTAHCGYDKTTTLTKADANYSLGESLKIRLANH